MASGLSFLRGQRDSLEDADFEIIVENEAGPKVHKKAHKFMLRQSPYFAALFRMNGQEAQKNSVELPSISAESMDLILDFMYGKQPAITRENALDLARAANYLQLNELKIMSVNAYFETFKRLVPNAIITGLRALEEFGDTLAPGEHFTARKLVEILLIWSSTWTNIDLATDTVLAVIMQYKTIPNVVFYILNEWNKLTKPDPEKLKIFINLYFKGTKDKIDMPPLAVAMLAKLEIMNKAILSKFNISDKLVATRPNSMHCKLSNDRWGTIQLEDKILCMYRFMGFSETQDDQDELHEIFYLVMLRIVGTESITIELKNNKQQIIGVWKKKFDNENQKFQGKLSLKSWRNFQQQVLDLTNPEERWCSLIIKLSPENQ